MSAVLEKLELDALSLPGEERARLAEKLWESLADSATPLDDAWQAEIERRRQEVHEGRVASVPGAEVSRRAWELAKRSGQ